MAKNSVEFIGNKMVFNMPNMPKVNWFEKYILKQKAKKLTKRFKKIGIDIKIDF